MTPPPVAPSSEGAAFWRYISGSLGRLMDMVAAHPEPVVRWRPAADGANSILGLAGHTLANAEDNILGLLAGGAGGRDRAEEFVDINSAALLDRWVELRPSLETLLLRAQPGWLDETVVHSRRGRITRREVLIVVARHAAEHLGQAELTRDLALAAGA